jgi:uroporphyrinogen decarboxylase
MTKVVGARIERDVHFDEFLKVLRRQGVPRYLPFYEHFATGKFMAARLPEMAAAKGTPRYWQLYAEFYLSLGYDCIPIEIGLSFGKIKRKNDSTYQSEEGTCIQSMDDFEKLAWPDEANPINLEPFKIIQDYIPGHIKMVAGVCGGPYEAATLNLLGVMGLSYALADQPGLVQAVFGKLKRLYVKANRQLAAMDGVGATRQGDDLGFKTGTFMPPDVLREHVFPIYKAMADEAHARGKPFVLHSCGQLSEVYEDLIACGIDAKHSYEDQITPVWEFQAKYGKRITPLGGLDVDTVCRSSEAELRAYTRMAVEKCWGKGRYWALGTGNSLTDYTPLENYLIVLDEAIKATTQE